VREAVLPREMLYMADEVFLAGTAVEVTPVHSVDRIAIGDGKPGKITKAIQDAFFGLVRGEAADRHRWLTVVPQTTAASGSVARRP
jgi:branched-chain amino acid aminotransferase